MKWNKFIEEYNNITDRIFYYLYEIVSNQINFQVDIKTAGKIINSINVFFNKESNIRYSLREDDFFNRKTLSYINVHKTVFLWTYFLMLSKVVEYKIGECL